MKQEWILPHPLKSTQSWLGLIFLCKPQNQTVHDFFSTSTKPNSAKFGMRPYFNFQLEIKMEDYKENSKWKTTNKIKIKADKKFKNGR